MADEQSLEQILAEVRAKTGGAGPVPARAQVEKTQDAKESLSSLDVYIRFGRETRSVEEITADIKQELADEQAAKEQPAKEQPAKEQPAKEQPAKEQPAKEQPAKEQPAPAFEPQPPAEEPTVPKEPKPVQPPEEAPAKEQPVITEEVLEEDPEPVKIASEQTSRFARKTPVAVDEAPTLPFEQQVGGSVSAAVAAAKASQADPLGYRPDNAATTPLSLPPLDGGMHEGRDLEKMRHYFEVNADELPPQGPVEEDWSYDTPEGAADCQARLQQQKGRQIVSLIGLCVLSCLLLYVNFAAVLGWPLPGALSLNSAPYGFCVANIALGVLAGVFASPLLVQGFSKLFRFAPSLTPMPALSYLFALAQGVVACFYPDATQKGALLLLPIGVLCLLFAQLGALLETGRKLTAFRLVCGEPAKEVAAPMTAGPVQQHLERLSSYDKAIAVHPVPTGHLQGFFRYAEENTSMGRFSRWAAPCLLVAALALGLVTAMRGGSTFDWVTAAAALVVVASPLSIGLSAPALFARLTKKLSARGAMVASGDMACQLADTNGVITDAADLFPSGTVTLHGVKTFDNYRIDEAILIVASVVYAAKSTYSEMFMDVIERRTEILKQVDSYLYEDGMGLSAWISNKRVLVGNRQLLENHDVLLPPLATEERYQATGRELLYLAVAGEPVAMFILQYTPDEEIQMRLEQLHQAGYDLFVKTCDSNVDAQKLGEVYDLEPEIFKILPGSCFTALEALEQPSETAPAKMAMTGRFSSFAGCMAGCAKFASSLRLIWVLQLCALLVCGGLVIFLSLTQSGFYQPLILLAVQLFWSALSLALPLAGEM